MNAPFFDPQNPYIKILEQISDLALYIDKDLKCQAFSRSFLKSFNYERNEIAGKSLNEIRDPFSDERSSYFINEALKGNSHSQKCWVEFPSIQNRFMDVNYKACTNAEGKTEGVVILAKDYSQFKKEKDKIEKNEEQFQKAFQLAPYPIMMHKEDGEVLIINETWLEITGFKRKEIKNLENWLELAFGSWKGQMANRYHDFWKKNRAIESEEYIVHTKDKKFRIWSFRCALLGTNEEDEKIAITTALDLTESKEYEEKLKYLNETLEERVLKKEKDLKQSEQEFRSAFETASHGMAIVSVDGIWIRANHSMCSLVGYSKEELAEKRIKNLTDEKTYKIEMDKIQSVLKGMRNSYSLEKQLIRKDNQKVWTLTSSSLVRDEHNTPLHFITQIIDINDRKLFEKNLLLAKQQAELANKHKSEFLATISHEIRTPLNSIIGFSELLHDSLKGSTREIEYINTISNSGSTLLNLINDILDLSSIDAGQLEIVNSKVNLKELLNEIIKVFEYQSNKKGIKIGVTFLKGTPMNISMDEKRLKQILLNLLGNAIKFTDKGKIGVAISGSNFREKSFSLHIKVSDSGIGIHPTATEEIFEAFRQQSGQDSRKFGGTGLGLSITKKLVHAMNGNIKVQSIENKGSTFFLCFDKIEIESLEFSKSKTPLGVSTPKFQYKNLKANTQISNKPKREKAIKLINEKLPVLINKACQSGILSEYEQILQILREIEQKAGDLQITEFLEIACSQFEQFEFEELNIHLNKIFDLNNNCNKQLGMSDD